VWQVDKFYDYWFSFKSWREFPHPDEEDVEQAESREHKRWIERCVEPACARCCPVYLLPSLPYSLAMDWLL
jgi:hypothetical protein